MAQELEQVVAPKQLSEMEIFNTDERIFKAWGTVEVIDKENELLPISEFKKIMPIIMKRGGIVTDRHSNRVVGKILNYEYKMKQTSEGEREGVYLTVQIHSDYELDDMVWEGIKEGAYAGMSFGGRNKFEGSFRDGENMAKILTGLEGFEFSVVPSMGNQEATMDEINYLAKSDKAKSNIKKSLDAIKMHLNDIEKSENYLKNNSQDKVMKDVKKDEAPETPVEETPTETPEAPVEEKNSEETETAEEKPEEAAKEETPTEDESEETVEKAAKKKAEDEKPEEDEKKKKKEEKPEEEEKPEDTKKEEKPEEDEEKLKSLAKKLGYKISKIKKDDEEETAPSEEPAKPDEPSAEAGDDVQEEKTQEEAVDKKVEEKVNEIKKGLDSSETPRMSDSSDVKKGDELQVNNFSEGNALLRKLKK